MSGATGFGCSPSEWRRIECCASTENSSPVGQVPKPATAPSSTNNPFRMRARHADEMATLCRQTGAGKLGFLAAHDVGRIGEALGEAGHDADVAAAGRE